MVRREDDRAAALRTAGAEVVVGDLLWKITGWVGGHLSHEGAAVVFLGSPAPSSRPTSIAKLGFGDVVVGPGWRVVAGIERLTGILLVGWSTAFVCAVVKGMYEHWRAGAQHVLTHHAADFEFERHGRGAPRRGGGTPRLQESGQLPSAGTSP